MALFEVGSACFPNNLQGSQKGSLVYWRPSLISTKVDNLTTHDGGLH